MKDFSSKLTERDRRWQEPFLQQVAGGNIPGYRNVNFYGEGVISTADAPREAWDLNARYSFLPWNAPSGINTVSSSDVDDTQLVAIEGLVRGTGVEKMIFVQLNGQNKVQVDIYGDPIDFWRVNFMYVADTNMTTGIGSDPEGDIYIYQDTALTGGVPDDLTKVASFIQGPVDVFEAENRSHVAVYTVPKNHTAYIWDITWGLARTQAATVEVSFDVRLFGGVFLNSGNQAMTSTGTGLVTLPRLGSAEFPELTDVRVMVQSVSANNVGVSAGSLVTVRNNAAPVV